MKGQYVNTSINKSFLVIKPITREARGTTSICLNPSWRKRLYTCKIINMQQLSDSMNTWSMYKWEKLIKAEIILSPLTKTYLQGQRKGMGSKMEQDLYTFPGHLNLDVYHLWRFLYWKQVLQIQWNCAWNSKYTKIFSKEKERLRNYYYISTCLIGLPPPLGSEGKGLCWKSTLDCRSTNKWLHNEPNTHVTFNQCMSRHLTSAIELQKVNCSKSSTFEAWVLLQGFPHFLCDLLPGRGKKHENWLRNQLNIKKKKNYNHTHTEKRLEAKLTGKPLCLLLRKIETTSATLTTRGKYTTFKAENEDNCKFKTSILVEGVA